MKIVYFPYTVIDPRKAEKLAALWGPPTLLQPSPEARLPETRALEEAGLIETLCPETGHFPPLTDCIKAFEQWAEQSAGSDLEALMKQGAPIPFFSDQSLARIVAELRSNAQSPGQDAPDRSSLPDIFQAQLLLAMAQKFDSMRICRLRPLTGSLDIEARRLTEALKNVSFKVDDGDFLIIIGLSGSGKSTLLRCINRLIDPTEGDILWNGVNLARLEGEELRSARRKIGMIFQHFNLVKRSSVLTNVLTGRLGYAPTFQSLMHHFSKEDKQHAWENLRRLGIEDQALKRADELSGGQQQRVGVARALMQDPELILADEPVASLDPVLAHSIMTYLEKLNQELGTTFLFSTHDEKVIGYLKRKITLNDGKVAEDQVM